MSTHGFFAARSWEFDRWLASQADTRHCLRRLFQEVTAGNVPRVFIAAPFLNQHDSHKFAGLILKILRVSDRNRLPWILEHRHTRIFFFNELRLQSLVEQSNVIVHVTDYCQ